MNSQTLPPFDLAAPQLETGRVVIEASAGTGKTYSLTVLVVRHVAELGLTADQLLMVTFTNAATAELREKTREEAQKALLGLQTNTQSSPWMANMFRDEKSRDKAIVNLQDFISRFDEASITTIHGFCQNILRRAGLDSPTPENYEVRSNVDDIIDQSITDLLINDLTINAGYLFGQEVVKGEPKPLTIKNLRKSITQLHDAVKRVLGNPKALVLPEPAIVPDLATLKGNLLTHTKQALLIAEITQKVVEEVRRRCFEAGVLTYDDMVYMVAETLEGEDERAKNLADEISSQFSLIMVDEFQDTDAMQWSIFEKIFEANKDDLTLITVGDPKQAIYRFRGADVQVYLNAVKNVNQSHQLDTNYRSDAGLLQALETLLAGQDFDISGDAPFVSVSHVRTSALSLRNSETSPIHLPGKPLEIRYIANNSDLGAHDKENNNTGLVKPIFWRDLANHVVELLTHAQLPDKHSVNRSSIRDITPSDIAILVNSHGDAEEVVRYLSEAQVPAVRFKADNVFSSTAAMNWLMLLGALAYPGRPNYVRAYALSWFGSSDDDELITADDELVAQWQRECSEYAALLQKRGISALYLTLRSKTSFLSRVLAEVDGERHITDLDHIAELLSAIPSFARSAGAIECYEKLVQLVDESGDTNEDSERRIEGDDVAVKVMTIHSSKGLQFPIVFLPTLHKKPNNKNNNPLMFSFDFFQNGKPQRAIDTASGFDKTASKWIFDPTSSKDPNFKEIYNHEYTLDKVSLGRKILAKEDAFYDTKRLLYVALTRAEHKVILYWSATGENNGKGNIRVPLAELLNSHSDPKPATIPVEKIELDKLMQKIVAASNGTIAAIPLNPQKAAPLVWNNSSASTPPQADIARFDRSTEIKTRGYARWSYSGWSKMLKGKNNNDENGRSSHSAEVKDNSEEETNSPSVQLREHSVPLSVEQAIATMKLFNIAGSGVFGNKIHEIFDSIDPGSPDYESDIRDQVEWRFQRDFDDEKRSLISEALITCITCPLGEIFAGNTLHSLGTTHRLSELEFNFFLPQDGKGAFKLSKLGELMVQHESSHPELLAYGEALRNHDSTAEIAGFMVGFIDAVFRIQDDDKVQYVITDYKTDTLHKPKDDRSNPFVNYHPENLVDAMTEKHYIIQVLAYSVALHRYLKWRQPNYNPDVHLGGAAYLFLRGMTGLMTEEQQPRPFGVFHWRPSTSLVLALDALFAGEEG
jgi:exodeoxyribonuclease V beta subunit